MVWIDIVVVILMVLVAFVGLYKGFLNSILGFINSFVSLIIAFFLAKPMAKLVGLIPKVSSGLSNFFAGKFAGIGELGTALTETTSVGDIIAESSGIKGVFKWILTKFTGNVQLSAGEVPANYFGQIIGAFVLLIIGFIVSFILIRIVIALLSKIFDKFKRNNVVNWVDRIFGFLLGAVKAFIVVGLIMIILSIIPFINNKIDVILNQTTIVKAFASWFNSIVDFIASKVDLQAFISGIL